MTNSPEEMAPCPDWDRGWTAYGHALGGCVLCDYAGPRPGFARAKPTTKAIDIVRPRFTLPSGPDDLVYVGHDPDFAHEATIEIDGQRTRVHMKVGGRLCLQSAMHQDAAALAGWLGPTRS